MTSLRDGEALCPDRNLVPPCPGNTALNYVSFTRNAQKIRIILQMSLDTQPIVLLRRHLIISAKGKPTISTAAKLELE
jgi:hypothetical protein